MTEQLESGPVGRGFTPGTAILVFGLVYCLGAVNTLRPLFRFSSELANTLANWVWHLFPLAMLLYAMQFKRYWVKVLTVICLVLGVGTTFIAVFILMPGTRIRFPDQAVTVGDTRVVPISDIVGDPSLETNWYYPKFSHERQLMPGILLVKLYPCGEGYGSVELPPVQIISSYSIKFERREWHLKPWVYF